MRSRPGSRAVAARSPPQQRPARRPGAGDPAGRHRGIRHDGRARRLAYARRALPVRGQLGHRPQRPLRSSRSEGFLGHPHTSAGRVPTDEGYRFYVESLIGEMPLPPIEQLMIRHQFGQVEFATDQWFRLAATTLASATRSAGLATPAKPRAARIRRLELVGIGERMASLDRRAQRGVPQAGPPDDRARHVRGRAGRGRPAPQPVVPEPDRGRPRGAPALVRGGARRRPGLHARAPRRRARPPNPARVRRGHRRAALQRRPPPRHGRARVRGIGEAPPRLRRSREPHLPRRAVRGRHPRRRPAGLHRPGEPSRGDGRRRARPGAVRSTRRRRRRRRRAGPHPPPLRRRRSARSASSPA